MDENKTQSDEIQVDLPESVAQGTYANMAIIAHSTSEFVIDFIGLVPGVPKAKVKSRIIMTPDNVRSLLHTLDENLRQFDEMMARDGDDDASDTYGIVRHGVDDRRSCIVSHEMAFPTVDAVSCRIKRHFLPSMSFRVA